MRENGKKKMRGISKVIIVLLLIAATVCFLVPVKDYVDTKSEYDDVIDEVIDDMGDENIDGHPGVNRRINWSKLLDINGDIIAWIYIPGTNIDYPVMRVDDNNSYLRRNVYGDYSRSGVLFVDSATLDPFEGLKTIIYGHNMLNGTMFSNLKNYKSETYMREHNKIYIYLPDDSRQVYDIFAFRYADMYDIQVYDANISAEELSEFYDSIADNSVVDIERNNDGNMIMLSTCVNSIGQGKRSVVYASLEES